MTLASAWQTRRSWNWNFLSALASSSVRRTLRMTSGLILFTYIGAHLINHSLGLISLEAAERGMEIAVEAWYSLPGTLLLYGAAATHFVLALWAVYERRTFRLPPLELLRIALGFSLPIILIGHAANTRLAYELFGLSSDYTRVVTNLWVADQQGMQLGLLAPGWLHGCLGLNFAFKRRPLFRQLRFVLFAFALLLPVFSALGFIAMGRELSTSPAAAAAAQEYLSPAHDNERIAIERWRNSLVAGYFSIIGLTFGARTIRNLLERGRKRLVSISYPGRTVQVPRGWSVLEASRAFHIAHAAMCGGRARCSTCRVRVTAGEDACPQAGADERGTLQRIGAPADVRLACQLRPRGNVSVIPLVRTEQPIYRAAAPQRHTGERDVVVLFCDFLNRAELAKDHLPQDLLYVITLYVEALGNAIRAAHGTLSYIELDSTCGLFGLECDVAQAARQALQTAATIECAISDLNDRLGRQWDCKMRIALSIHSGRAAVGEIGSSDPPAVMAIGEAVDVANELRKAAVAHDLPFAISEQVYEAAGIVPSCEQNITVPGRDISIPVCLAASVATALPANLYVSRSPVPKILRKLRA
jgi:adenylate cyclase